MEHPVWLAAEPGLRPVPQKHSVEYSTPATGRDLDRQKDWHFSMVMSGAAVAAEERARPAVSLAQP
jgi:hypothetical protein